MAKKNPKSTVKKPRLKHIVCKPCWELKYCPYGPLVEFFPLPADDITTAMVRRSYKSWIDAIKEGRLKTHRRIYEAIEKILCLKPDRWGWIKQFQTEELQCSIFGHICPVFLSAEPLTETKERRRRSRSIPRDVMLKVIRRDGQICQGCFQPVPDLEVEFDHIIPYSKGGASTADNLRLLCTICNRQKRDSLKEFLSTNPLDHLYEIQQQKRKKRKKLPNN
ncbi:MAG: HNH endonuclease [Sedimentisphaerales bacterium]